MLINRDQFLHFANRYKHCREEQEKFQVALRPFFDSPVCRYLQKAIDGLEDLLVVVSECQDEDGIFWWWADAQENKIIEVRDTEGITKLYDVETAEGLYNYLYDLYHHDD